MRTAKMTLCLVVLGLSHVAAEESLESLAPLAGEWVGGESGGSAHPLLSIVRVTEAVDGVWIDTTATTRLNMGDRVPIRIHVATSTENSRIYARAHAKASRNVHFQLVSAAAGILVWDELSREPDRTRVQMKPIADGGYEATLKRWNESVGGWVDVRAVTYASAVLRVSAGGISFTMPREWERATPRGPREQASLVLPPPPNAVEGTAAGGLVLYHFGPDGAGSVDAVLERWSSQVQPTGSAPTDASAPSRAVRLDAHQAHMLVVSGTYRDSRGQAQPNVTLWAAILEPTEPGVGPHYLKAVGPGAVIAHWRERLDDLLQSIQLER